MILDRESKAPGLEVRHKRFGDKMQWTRDYLSYRWQEAFDQLSEHMSGAMIRYYQINGTEYNLMMYASNDIAMEEGHRKALATGNDFLDLIKGYGRRLIIEDCSVDPRLTESIEYQQGFNSLMGMPVMDHTRRMVGLFVVMLKEPHTFLIDEIKTISWLGESVEESIKVIAIEEAMSEAMDKDPLTQLTSREKMDQNLAYEFERSRRSQIPFSLIVIDIDGFHSINESWGFDVGDRVLKECVNLVMARVRYIDLIARYDSDRLMILCPQTDLLSADKLVGDLFDTLSNHLFRDVGKCYFSIGSADYSGQGEALDDLLKRLNQALYRVKAFGGNSHYANYH